jgi:hypothetical protein
MFACALLNTVIERKPPLNLFRSQGLLIKLQFTLKKTSAMQKRTFATLTNPINE